MALLARKLRKFMRKKKLFPKKKIIDKGELEREKEKEKESITCFECKKSGHYKSDYPLLKNTLKKKKKAFMVTWGDSGESS